MGIQGRSGSIAARSDGGGSVMGGRRPSMAGSSSAPGLGLPGLGGEKRLSRKDLEEAVFSVLYVMRAQESANVRLTVLNVIVDFLQLLVFPLDGSKYNWWNPPYVANVVRGILNALPYNFLNYAPYHVYAIVYGLVVALVAASVADAAWVLHSFRKNHFRFMWPVKLLKLAIALFFQSLYLSSVAILLRALDCTYVNMKAPYMMTQYPDVPCWGFPNGILSVVAVVATVVVVIFAGALTVIQTEPNVRPPAFAPVAPLRSRRPL
eukprot:tig00000317_g24042.t1